MGKEVTANPGQVPYGYVRERGSKSWTIVPEEAEMVREIFSLRSRGMGYYKIAKALNAEGYTTRVGTPLTKMNIWLIVNNEQLYRGKKRIPRTSLWTQGSHEAIL